MTYLEKEELKSINGGIGVWGIIGGLAALVFGVGIFDGLVRPLKCN